MLYVQPGESLPSSLLPGCEDGGLGVPLYLLEEPSGVSGLPYDPRLLPCPLPEGTDPCIGEGFGGCLLLLGHLTYELIALSEECLSLTAYLGGTTLGDLLHGDGLTEGGEIVRDGDIPRLAVGIGDPP